MLQNRDRRVSLRLKWRVQDRDGTGTWIRPGTMGICSSIHDPKGYHGCLVLANLKDNIGWFEARHIPKFWKILWPWKIWCCVCTTLPVMQVGFCRVWRGLEIIWYLKTDQYLYFHTRFTPSARWWTDFSQGSVLLLQKPWEIKIILCFAAKYK